jgi:hypothetical protein
MKKILLLGGSAQQLVAIKAAKELGYYTIVCDYLPDNPGQYEADKFYATSTTDIEAVYEIAKEEQINGILAYASDPAALPAAIVAEKLGLPTNPAKSVEILGLKYPWRKKRTLYNCQRIENYADTYDAHYRAKLWRIIEICNKRGRNVQYKVKQATDDNIEIEYSVVVSLSPILFTYQCLRKAAVNQRLRHSNENGQQQYFLHTCHLIILSSIR